jgi:hypothetical protein
MNKEKQIKLEKAVSEFLIHENQKTRNKEIQKEINKLFE